MLQVASLPSPVVFRLPFAQGRLASFMSKFPYDGGREFGIGS
jgi:hypothetical protein